LAPFLLCDPQAYCFSPAEAEADRLRRRHEERVTPLSCRNVPRQPDKQEKATQTVLEQAELLCADVAA